MITYTRCNVLCTKFLLFLSRPIFLACMKKLCGFKKLCRTLEDRCVSRTQTRKGYSRFEYLVMYSIKDEEEVRRRTRTINVSSKLLVCKVVQTYLYVYCEYPHRHMRELLRHLKTKERWPMSARIQLLRIFATIAQFKRDRLHLAFERRYR